MKLKMTIDECINFADDWSRGTTIHEDLQGWRVVCMLLANEVRRLQAKDKSLQRAILEARIDEQLHHTDDYWACPRLDELRSQLAELDKELK